MNSSMNDEKPLRPMSYGTSIPTSYHLGVSIHRKQIEQQSQTHMQRQKQESQEDKLVLVQVN